MLNGIEAVIFDLDGTLVDSMWVWKSIDEDYISKYNLTPPNDFYEKMEGLSYTETAQYFLDIFPELPHTVESLKREWYEMSIEKYKTEISFKNGAKDFLIYLRDNGIKTGIATSNDHHLVDEFLHAKDAAEFFDTICTSCEVKRGKPAPDVYLAAANNLGINPCNCLVFEDVPAGIMSGKNAGMRVCAVEDKFSHCQLDKKKSLADYYISNYYDIFNHTFEVL